MKLLCIKHENNFSLLLQILTNDILTYYFSIIYN